MPDQTSLKQKTQHKIVITHWVLVKNSVFEPFWNSPPFWKPVERTFYFFKIQSSYFNRKCGKKNKEKYAFWDVVVFETFFAIMASKKFKMASNLIENR
jgi:hypothetical protein